MKTTDCIGAEGLHAILMRNMEALDRGELSVERANAIARLGNTIFQGVRTRLKVQSQAKGCSSSALTEWAR